MMEKPIKYKDIPKNIGADTYVRFMVCVNQEKALKEATKEEEFKQDRLDEKQKQIDQLIKEKEDIENPPDRFSINNT